MARIKYLTIDEHRAVAAELGSIRQSVGRLLRLTNGRIPAALMDRLMALERNQVASLRSRFEREMFTRYQGRAPECTFRVYVPPPLMPDEREKP